MFDVISAGHLCVDISPKIPQQSGDTDNIFIPGKLTNVNELVFATGGASANVGIALNKLGMNCAVIGKTGGDEIGDIITRLLIEQNVSPEFIIRKKEEFSSYTIVIAPPGVDRIFLHYPGANDTFSMEDIDLNLLEQAKLFHFGYPPLMKQFYSNDGSTLSEMMRRAKETGITTSLDMSLPDPNSLSGAANWEKILNRTLKYVDIFTPSIEELLYMLDRGSYTRQKNLDQDILKNLDIEQLSVLSDIALDMGCKIIVIKCGKAGYYLRTAGSERLLRMGRAMPSSIQEWAARELFSTVYHVENIISATGAGDCSIAGFIAALLTGCSPEWAINTACGVGSMAITTYGAVDGIVTLDKVKKKISKGWEKTGNGPKTDNWEYDKQYDIYNKKK